MKRIFVTIVCLFALYHSSFSQDNELYIGVDLPLYYKLGYQQKLSDHFSLNGQIGLLTKPFDGVILDVLKMYDTDEVLINTIGEAFTVGLNLQTVLKWHIKKYYIGATYSYLMLNAQDCPADLIENYYGVTIPQRRSPTLTLQSNLHNAGILMGKKFTFKNPKLSLNLELSFLKTFASSSYIKNRTNTVLENLSEEIDRELNHYYVDYGYLPSINIYFVYTLGPK